MSIFQEMPHKVPRCTSRRHHWRYGSQAEDTVTVFYKWCSHCSVMVVLDVKGLPKQEPVEEA